MDAIETAKEKMGKTIASAAQGAQLAQGRQTPTRRCWIA